LAACIRRAANEGSTSNETLREQKTFLSWFFKCFKCLGHTVLQLCEENSQLWQKKFGKFRLI
jgi:hypothetical protein